MKTIYSAYMWMLDGKIECKETPDKDQPDKSKHRIPGNDHRRRASERLAPRTILDACVWIGLMEVCYAWHLEENYGSRMGVRRL